MKCVGLASLYEPLEFLEAKVRNLNACATEDILIYFSDCSTETTWREVRRIVEGTSSFPYVLDHHENRQTLYWTWNWIIEHSREEYHPEFFCNVNVDDVLHPEYFRRMMGHLDAHPEHQIVGCSWLVTGAKNEPWPPKAGNGQVLTASMGTLGHFPMWRASLHDRVGLFDPRMVAIGDAHFWGRIGGVMGKGVLGVNPDFLGCYVSHAGNLYHTAKGPAGQSGEAWDRSLMAP